MDRNATVNTVIFCIMGSLSARRAWIEIETLSSFVSCPLVALRKESVDRNRPAIKNRPSVGSVALRKESVDRNKSTILQIYNA